jgi:hypothetical protein
MNSGCRSLKQELFAGMGRLAELTGGTLRGEIHDVLASDDHFVIRPGRDAERIGKFWSYPQAAPSPSY